jgi:hypothetical protein
MPKRKQKKRPSADDDLDLEAKSPRGPDFSEERGQPSPAAKQAAPRDEDDDDFGDLSGIADANGPYEPDPQEVDELTDRIFGSVLSRFGWEMHDGRLEHTGDRDRQRR